MIPTQFPPIKKDVWISVIRSSAGFSRVKVPITTPNRIREVFQLLTLSIPSRIFSFAVRLTTYIRSTITPPTYRILIEKNNQEPSITAETQLTRNTDHKRTAVRIIGEELPTILKIETSIVISIIVVITEQPWMF